LVLDLSDGVRSRRTFWRRDDSSARAFAVKPAPGDCLHKEAGGSRFLILLGTGLMAVVLVAQVIHLWSTRPEVLAFTVAAVLGSLLLEWLILRWARNEA
jgi:hypothetical protein